MTESAIAVAGKTGSGKSTIARELADQLGRQCVSFSSEVRSFAKQRGLDEDRETLQELGEELISRGWDEFSSSVLAQSEASAPVIDGVRHVGAVISLTRLLAPTPLLLIFLEVPERLRRERLQARGHTKAEIDAADSHRNEGELPDVKRLADFVVSNDRPVNEVVAIILERLGPDARA
jgi:cytidylate kinase